MTFYHKAAGSLDSVSKVMPENADIYHNEENATHCTSVSKTLTFAAKLVITALPL